MLTFSRVPKFVGSVDGKLTISVARFHFYGRLGCAISIIGRCGFSTSFATDYQAATCFRQLTPPDGRFLKEGFKMNFLKCELLSNCLVILISKEKYELLTGF